MQICFKCKCKHSLDVCLSEYSELLFKENAMFSLQEWKMVLAPQSYVPAMMETAATSRCPRGPTPWRCQPSPQRAPQRWTDPVAIPPRLNWWQRSEWSVCSSSSWPCSSSAGCPYIPLTPGKRLTFPPPTGLSLEPPSRSSTSCPTHLPASTPLSTALWTSVFERRFSPLSLAAAGPAVEEASGKVMMRSLPPERPCLSSTTPLSAQWDRADSRRTKAGKDGGELGLMLTYCQGLHFGRRERLYSNGQT